MSEPIKSVVMFDLDGCVSDDRWRHGLLPAPGTKGNAAYADYHAECNKDPVLFTGANILRDHIKQGHIILFCTARPVTVGERTAEWIAANFGLTPKDFSILMRQENDERSAVDLKREFAEFVIKNSKQNGSPIVAAYDDRPEIVDVYREMGINAAVLNADGIVQPEPAAPAEAPTPFSGTVPELLVKAADLYRERNSLYKDDYKKIGNIWRELLPEGANLKTTADFNRFSLMLMILAKVSRYARNFNDGGHDDSLNDLAVYAMMLKEVDDSLPV